MGNYDVPVLDIMRRTMWNLEFIEQHCDREGPYEVTQLVNSFLGALAHPWEKLKEELEKIPLSTIEGADWPIPKREQSSDENPTNAYELVRLVRHAFAHGNIRFLPDDQNEIRQVQFWNEHRGRRTWGTKMDVKMLRRFLECFVRLAEEREAVLRRS